MSTFQITIGLDSQNQFTADPDPVTVTPGETAQTLQFDLDSTVTGAGYTFQTTIANPIVVAPVVTSPPVPYNEFTLASVTSTRVTLSDSDSGDGGTSSQPRAYKYTVYLQGPNGPVIFDPQIKNEG